MSKPVRTKYERFKRANDPGLYRCPECGELLSAPAALYASCPGPVPARKGKRQVPQDRAA